MVGYKDVTVHRSRVPRLRGARDADNKVELRRLDRRRASSQRIPIFSLVERLLRLRSLILPIYPADLVLCRLHRSGRGIDPAHDLSTSHGSSGKPSLA